MWNLYVHYKTNWTYKVLGLTTLQLRTELAERMHDSEQHDSVASFEVIPVQDMS